jgi:hypothetical protein
VGIVATVRLAPTLAVFGLALWGACGRTAYPSTLLYFKSASGDYIGQGEQRLLTPADGVFAAQADGAGGLEVRFFGAGSSFWVVSMAPPSGATLAPGTYESAARFSSPGGPGLDVSGEGRGCDIVSGRFTVHEVAFNDDGAVIAFAADFEQHCEAAPAALIGAVRYRSGDLICASADGGSCDDVDPCTHGDICHAHVCAGVEPTGKSCAPADECHRAGICDRTTGACTRPVVAEADPCDDGSACTIDRCDVGGCVHEPVAGTCWVARPVLSAVSTAAAFGHSARCSLRCRAPSPGWIILAEDGTFREPGGDSTACPLGRPVTFPDEVGMVRRGHGHRLFLQPTNLDEVLAAVAECDGVTLPRLHPLPAWVRPSPDGQRLSGRDGFRARVPGRIPVSVVIVERFTAVPGLSPSGPVEPPVPADHLPACSPTLRPSCIVR